LLRYPFVRSVRQYGEDLVQVLGEFFGTTGSLSGLSEPAKKLAAHVQRQLLDEG
jgi:hypothetical protein